MGDQQDDKMMFLPTQVEAAYTPLSLEAGRACANCRWFSAQHYEYGEPAGSKCHLIQSWPDDILPTGYCERHEMKPPPPDWMKDISLPTDESGTKEERGVIARLIDRFKGHQAPQQTGFKVYGERWVAWWTNNFKDREDEFFPEAAIDRYVARVDTGMVPYPELWYWHTPGSKHGQADWVGRIDHYCVAAGTFDDTPAAQAAKAYYSKHRQGVSHGFTYDPRFFKDSAYQEFNTFEISPLPPKVAANAFTDFEGVKAVAISPDKQRQLEQVFGKDIAAQIIAETEAKSKAIEELGVAYKDFADIVGGEAAADEKAVEKVEGDLKTFIADVVTDSAEVVTIARDTAKALTAVRTVYDTRIKAIEDGFKAHVQKHADQIAALKEQLDARPRTASADAETELTPDRVQSIQDTVKQQSTHTNSFWGTEVSDLPDGE
jgi:hypothetical protein